MTASALATRSRPLDVRIATALGAWLLVASAVGASGVIDVERPVLVPIALFGSLATIFVLRRTSAAVREAIDAVPTSVLTALHVIRAPIGAAFLVLSADGRLDPTFAGIAGPGDVAAGVLAFAVLPATGLETPGRRRAVMAAHALGLLDIAIVIATAQRILLFSGHPETMAALVGLPGALLPTFLVPLVVASHVLAIRRSLSAGPGTSR